MIVLRLLLFPFTLLYGFAITIRNLFYQYKILTRTSFNFPVICVGNLSVGGTGKTPHIEWLIRMLQQQYKVGVLSRGYKRKTTGYVLATTDCTVETIGDEPYQIAQKFTDITVAVSENRVFGVPHLLADAPETQVILMDDGFQHLPIKPGYSIILTDYANLFYDDWLMPSGTLREFRSAYKRAQCIIVTKCPSTLSETDKQNIIKHIRPQQQLVLFSTIQYDELVQLHGSTVDIKNSKNVLAFSGIAKQQLFVNELQKRFTQVSELSFSDHKEYDTVALHKIAAQFNLLPAQNSIIVTTEKDAVKLNTETAKTILGNLPVFYLPISVQITDTDASKLSNELIPFIQSFDTE